MASKKKLRLTVLEALRKLEDAVQLKTRALAELGCAPKIDFSPSIETSEISSKALNVIKTEHRKVLTKRYGPIHSVEHIYGPKENRHLDGPGQGNRLHKYESEELKALVRDGANFGYDIIAHVGRARFQKHEQRLEISSEFEKEFGIPISTGTISNLGVLYLVYHKCVHDESVPLLKETIHGQGGYFLHVDCTQEGSSDLVFMGLADVPRMGTMVLRADRIETESEENLIPSFRGIKDDFDKPLMLIRDMGKGLQNAHGKVFLEVPGHICRTHIVGDVTKDLLKKQYFDLKNHMSKLKVRTTLVNIHHEAEVHLKEAGVVWKGKNASPPEVDLKDLHVQWAYGILHLTSLVFRYTKDDKGYQFPHGLPYVNLYRRCIEIRPKVKTLLCTVAKANQVYDPLMELDKLLKSLNGDSERAVKLKTLYRKITRTKPIIEEFREITGIQPTEPTVVGVKNAKVDIEEKLLCFKKDLEKRGMNVDEPEAWECRKVVEHIDKYWDELVSMVWVEDPEDTEKVIVGRSENNIEEEKFKDMKSNRRRTTGKKHVVADVNYYGPYLAYQLSLRNKEYVRLLYGSLEDMATRFSQVDPDRFREELAKFNAEKKGPQRTNETEEVLNARFDCQVEEIDRKLDEERYSKVPY